MHKLLIESFFEDSEKERKTMENKNKNFSAWNKKGSNQFIPSDNSIIMEKLEAGIYEIKVDQNIGYYALKKDVFLDELFHLPGNVQNDVINDIRNFIDSKEKIKEYGFAYKRGILLHGPPGNGKSSIINLVCKEIIENLNGIAITIKSENDLENFSNFMPEYFRVIEPERPLLCIIEDIDGLVEDSYTETLLLNLLDGIGQMEHTIYIGTSNYPEKLKDRILNRPSRFDRRYEIPFPDADVRRFYLQKKLKDEDIEKIDLEMWVKKTEGLSISHLTDLVKSVLCMNCEFESALKILKDMGEKLDSYNYSTKTKKIGFG